MMQRENHDFLLTDFVYNDDKSVVYEITTTKLTGIVDHPIFDGNVYVTIVAQGSDYEAIVARHPGCFEKSDIVATSKSVVDAFSTHSDIVIEKVRETSSKQ